MRIFGSRYFRSLGVILLASVVYYILYWGNYLHRAVAGIALAEIIRRHLAGQKRIGVLPREPRVYTDRPA
jgi:hypothetical protein